MPKEWLVSQTKRISDLIKKNNLPLFSWPPVQEKTKSQLEMTSLRTDCSLFSRLFIASQVRNGNLDEFFEHQAYPPALSQNRKLRSGSKWDPVEYLEDLVISQEKTNNTEVQVIILNGPAIVKMLRPGLCKKQNSLIMHHKLVFLPYIVFQTQHASRVDVVWDEYLPESLKAELTRSKRIKEVKKLERVLAHWRKKTRAILSPSNYCSSTAASR